MTSKGPQMHQHCPKNKWLVILINVETPGYVQNLKNNSFFNFTSIISQKD